MKTILINLSRYILFILIIFIYSYLSFSNVDFGPSDKAPKAAILTIIILLFSFLTLSLFKLVEPLFYKLDLFEYKGEMFATRLIKSQNSLDIYTISSFGLKIRKINNMFDNDDKENYQYILKSKLDFYINIKKDIETKLKNRNKFKDFNNLD